MDSSRLLESEPGRQLESFETAGDVKLPGSRTIQVREFAMPAGQRRNVILFLGDAAAQGILAVAGDRLHLRTGQGAILREALRNPASTPLVLVSQSRGYGLL